MLLDSRSLKEDVAAPMLASEDTPRACLLSETLPRGGAPRQVSTLWRRPTRVGAVYVQENEAGQPVVSFVAPDSVSVWRVMRMENGSPVEAGRVEGRGGDYITFTDEAGQAAEGYVVIARQKYREELGEIVEAEPSDETPLYPATLFERVFGF